MVRYLLENRELHQNYLASNSLNKFHNLSISHFILLICLFYQATKQPNNSACIYARKVFWDDRQTTVCVDWLAPSMCPITWQCFCISQHIRDVLTVCQVAGCLWIIEDFLHVSKGVWRILLQSGCISWQARQLERQNIQMYLFSLSVIQQYSLSPTWKLAAHSF